MEARVNVPGALHQLLVTRNRILELIEWDELAQREQRRGVPPGFEPHTSLRAEIRSDLRMMYGLFLSLSSDVRQVLQRPDLAPGKRELPQWRRRLKQLESDVFELRVTETFLRP